VIDSARDRACDQAYRDHATDVYRVAYGILRDPDEGVGDWLAPAAAAKTFLDAGIVMSPDGRRVYAAGLVAGAAAGPVAASSGILVFDAATLEPLDRWEPTAAFLSLAVSADGRSVYATGQAGFDAGGTARPGQQASITVFSATDGSVRLVAGRLGSELLTFTSPTLD
jgi:hypothetical protein